MRAMISAIKRMEIHDGDGLRSTVFFKGCPLKCIWCHNPESISFDTQVAFYKSKCVGCGMCKGERRAATAELCPVDAITVYGREYEIDELVSELICDAPFFERGGGVTLSGGECLAQPDAAAALARALCERGISVYIDTCGYASRNTLEKIIPYTDKFLYDIKAIDGTLHKRLTGRDNALVLDNLRYLCERGCRVEVRYPLVRGYNDAECEAIARFLSELPIERVKVLRYHNLSASRYEALGMENTLPATETTLDDVDAAVKTFENYGICAINGARQD